MVVTIDQDFAANVSSDPAWELAAVLVTNVAALAVTCSYYSAAGTGGFLPACSPDADVFAITAAIKSMRLLLNEIAQKLLLNGASPPDS